MISELSILDDLLNAHTGPLGKDHLAYRNHCYRVLNMCASLCDPNPQNLEKIAIAVAFHDLGIWTASTFDYLPPSMELAREHLAGEDRTEWIPELEAMILEHHKCTHYTAQPAWLVEPFRKADWIDVTMGALSFGLLVSHTSLG